MNNKIVSNAVWTDVKSCARCGGDHDNLVFIKFTNPIDEWTHFALCPYNEEPILMKVKYMLVVENDEQEQ